MTQLEGFEIKQLAFNLAQELTLQPRWLKLAVASKYSSIGKDRLKYLAIDKKIVGYKDKDSGRGDWIFDKESIDKYRLELCGSVGEKV